MRFHDSGTHEQGSVGDRGAQKGSKQGHLKHPVPIRAQVLGLQRAVGNAVVTQLLAGQRYQEPASVQAREISARRPLEMDAPHIQRAEGDDETEDDPRGRSRQSRPKDAPTGTVPIDQSDLDRETIHKIKDGIGAGPKDWVGVTPEGNVITTGPGGSAVDNGHVTDYARSGSETIPRWVWAVIGFVAMIGIIVLFATGVGEVGLILAGAGAAVVLIISAALKAAGRGSQPVAAADEGAEEEDSVPV